jgi:serine/threonine-protein kinase HSL1 (negative regulator of Swe1 kinase)
MENRTHDREGQFWYVAVYNSSFIADPSSGRVKIAKHSITGKYAAIKIVPKGLILNSRMSMSEAGARADKVLLGIEREIVIMKLIDHPNVLNLYDVWETSGEL